MIQVRLVPAPVEPVVLVKVVQLLRRVEHLELVARELVVVQQVGHRVLVVPAAAFEK
jgi:hypothetical protein